jgi:internalin A
MNREELLAIIEQAKQRGQTSLDLRFQDLDALLPEISQLTNLTSLDLSSNQLTVLPKEIGQLTNLRSLDLSSNQLTVLPREIGQLINLTSLDLSSNRLTILPGEMGQLINLMSLDLSSNRLTIWPKEIGQLTNLMSLDLSSNRLTVLPEEMGQLINLMSLDLSSNRLTLLPKEIGQLINLDSLSLSYNQLTVLPKEIEQLISLTDLDLRNNRLKILLESIGELIDLTDLDLRNNRLKRLPDSIGNLINLIDLDLSNNQFQSLPDSIGQLANLNHLYLSDNQLQALPNAIGQLTNLTHLYLGGNQIQSLPDEIGRLTNLTDIDLNKNRLQILPDEIGQLTGLTDLDFSNNQLQTLSDAIIQLTNLKFLILTGNPLSQIPPEVLKEGGLKVRDYYRQRLEEETDYLYESKLIILGQGGAGKTSLANKLIDSTYKLKLEGSENPEKSTEGIDVLHLDFPHPSGTPFRINLWDFGGQEIYHATHQFFLTKRSLYLLIADTRQDNTDFNYWLEVVELLSEASPVLIVKNEKQERPCQVNENQLRERFLNLKDIFPTNLATNRGLPEILAAVQHHISQLPHIGQPLPKTWARVRTALETDPRHHISQAEFLTLCDTYGFKRREDKLQLSGYLHDLGVCLHFQDDPILKHHVILKPEWGTTAVYKVLDTPKVQQNLGCFTHTDLAEIWADAQYTDMRDELLHLMMRFRLCYEIPNRPRTYIAPQLLSPNQPKYTWDSHDNLILRYRYEFMPKGMVTRFIVEMHKLIAGDWVWKDGVILQADNTRAEIIEAYYRNEIQIRVSGFPKKSLLERVRHEFGKIHDSYDRLRYQELIPCNCPTCKGSQKPHFYDLKRLQERLTNQSYAIECDIPPYAKVSVQSLIDDVLRPRDTPQPHASSPTQIFISYSHQDADWLAKLQTHLKPLMRNYPIDAWDDTRIQAGDEWQKEIEAALTQAQIAILLVSPDFLASDFIHNNELPPLLDAAKNQGVTILWIPIRPCLHDEAQFSRYQPAHNPQQPLASLSAAEQDRAFVNICQQVKRLAAGPQTR